MARMWPTKQAVTEEGTIELHKVLLETSHEHENGKMPHLSSSSHHLPSFMLYLTSQSVVCLLLVSGAMRTDREKTRLDRAKERESLD